MRRLRCMALVALAAAALGAQPPAFSGRWKLNVARSTWGRKPAPTAVTIEIDHRDPVLKYSGIVVDRDGENRQFEFAGATDGKEYPALRACGEGSAILERVGPYAILTTFKSSDGATVERTRMTLSRSGNILTYSVEVTGRGAPARWTEVYEKQ